MLERFSDEAAEAVTLADEEARRLGHGQVGTEHLLLGLIAEKGSVASEVLIAKGAPLAVCREKVVEALASRTATAPISAAEELPFSGRAVRALERAGRMSLRMGSEAVHTEHVLLAVLDVEGTAGQVLRRIAVDPEAVRQALMARSTGSAPSRLRRAAVEAPAEGPGPQCGTCSSPLETSLGQKEFDVASSHVVVFYCTACGTALGAQQH